MEFIYPCFFAVNICNECEEDTYPPVVKIISPTPTPNLSREELIKILYFEVLKLTKEKIYSCPKNYRSIRLFTISPFICDYRTSNEKTSEIKKAFDLNENYETELIDTEKICYDPFSNQTEYIPFKSLFCYLPNELISFSELENLNKELKQLGLKKI